jgi:V/A-type H+-transporting ATPase subunit G/H
LALEALNEIKKAEAKAEEIIKDAQNESKEIIRVASIKAEEQYNDIISKAKARAKEIIGEYTGIGNREAEPILEAGNKENTEISNLSPEKIESSVKLVIERIVNKNEHS